jgi:hypothetical protein
MAYQAGFSALGACEDGQDSGLITIIASPEDPVQIGIARPTGRHSADGRALYTLCFFGDRRPVTGAWVLADYQFRSAEDE